MTSHEFLDHTSETVLRLSAPDLHQLFAEAARAFGHLEQAGIAATGESVTRQIAITSTDPGALLADFLNELIWLAETEHLVPRSAEVRVLPPAALDATIVLVRLAVAPSLVKAATRHDLIVESEPHSVTARVTLDV